MTQTSGTPGATAESKPGPSFRSKREMERAKKKLRQLARKAEYLRARQQVLEEQCGGAEALKAMLEQEDRRIFAEAREQAYRESLVKVSERGKFVGAFFIGIASAFVISVGIWAAGLYFEYSKERSSQRAQVFAQRVQALQDFGSKFLKSASLAYEMQKEFARISEGPAELMAADTKAWRANIVSKYIEQPSMVTLASVYPATFGDDVVRCAESLRNSARAMLDSKTVKDVDDNMAKVQHCYDQVIDAMAGEIKASR